MTTKLETQNAQLREILTKILSMSRAPRGDGEIALLRLASRLCDAPTPSDIGDADRYGEARFELLKTAEVLGEPPANGSVSAQLESMELFRQAVVEYLEAEQLLAQLKSRPRTLSTRLREAFTSEPPTRNDRRTYPGRIL